MKISTSNGTIYKLLGSEKSFEVLAKAGYDCVDYGPTESLYKYGEGIYSKNAKEFEEFFKKDLENCKKAGLYVGQTHAPFPTYQYEKDKFDDMVEGIRKAIIATSVLESKIMVIHAAMPFNWKEDTDHEKSESINYAVYEKLLPTAHEYGITIALENMNMQKCTTGNIEQHLRYIDMMQDDLFKGCFDTGHANMSDYVCGEYVEKMGDRLVAIHVHDNNTYTDLHEPMYYGKCDWDRFAEGLINIGYKGTFSLESNHYKCPDEQCQMAYETFQCKTARYLLDKHGI